MFAKPVTLAVACGTCGKGPSSITLFSLSGETELVRATYLCATCMRRTQDAAMRKRLVDATDETYPVGKLPPSISSSLWSGKVPQLRAYALQAALTHFRRGSGRFLRHGLAPCLQDRVLKRVFVENAGMCSVFRRQFTDLALSTESTHIVLSSSKITPLEVQFLTMFLECGNQVLLDLSFNRLGRDSMLPLSRHMALHPSLRVINLSFGRLGNDGIAVVAESVSTNTTLTELNLASTGFGAEGAEALSLMLTRNTTLQDLNLSFNDLRPVGVAALCPGIARNRSVTALSLRLNVLGPDGAVVLARALRANDGHIKHVNVADNSIGEEGAAALASYWSFTPIRSVIQAVVPEYPRSMALFQDTDVADRAVAESIGHSDYADANPGRVRFNAE